MDRLTQQKYIKTNVYYRFLFPFSLSFFANKQQSRVSYVNTNELKLEILAVEYQLCGFSNNESIMWSEESQFEP